MVTYGIPTLIELNTVEQHCALCARLGLRFVELNTNFPAQQLHLLDAAQLRHLADRYGIFYTIHLNDEMPVGDFNPTVSKGYIDAVLETIDFAKEVGVQVLNMHISEGAHYTRPDGIVYFYEAYRAEYLQRMAFFRDACTDAIGNSGIHICMENSKPYLPFQKAALDLLLESPAFALTLDIGHNYCSGFVDEDWILQRRDRLIHMHIHDANNGRNDHLPLGHGELDIAKYLAFGNDLGCTAVIEVKTLEGLEKSLPIIQQEDPRQG